MMGRRQNTDLTDLRSRGLSEETIVTIHRGSHQIGGCCTEISYKNTHIAIDVGSPLPGEDETSLKVQGLTFGRSSFDAVFLRIITATMLAKSEP